jgi:hypothetical protein
MASHTNRRKEKTVLFFCLVLFITVCLMIMTISYTYPDSSVCRGRLGAGLPFAFLCDYSIGGSPLSSWGKIDINDFPYISPFGFCLNFLICFVLVWITRFIVLGLSRLIRCFVK